MPNPPINQSEPVLTSLKQFKPVWTSFNRFEPVLVSLNENGGTEVNIRVIFNSFLFDFFCFCIVDFNLISAAIIETDSSPNDPNWIFDSDAASTNTILKSRSFEFEVNWGQIRLGWIPRNFLF